MPEAVIVAACHTAIGTSFKGALAGVPAADLPACAGRREPRWTPPRNGTEK